MYSSSDMDLKTTVSNAYEVSVLKEWDCTSSYQRPRRCFL